MRRGDVSLTGAFLELDVAVGEPGSIHQLRLRTRDGEHQVDVPARVIRVMRTDDLFGGSSVSGVAFEFLVHAAEVKAAVHALVRHAAGVGDDDPGWDETGGVASFSVETRWQLRAGERVRIEVPSVHGANTLIEGRVVRSRKHKSGTYRNQVEIEGEAPLDIADRTVSGLRDAIAAVADEQRIAAVADEQRRVATRREHLSGDLSRIQVPSLLSLVALEQMTGVIGVRSAERSARIYVRAGQIVDVVELESEAETECEGRGARAILGALCHSREGRFEVFLEEVTRPDRLHVSTTALLLDLARTHDEDRRVA